MASRLRVLRVMNDLTAVELARRAGGVHPELLRKVESRKWTCPAKWQPGLALVLGVGVGELFEDSGLARVWPEASGDEAP